MSGLCLSGGAAVQNHACELIFVHILANIDFFEALKLNIPSEKSSVAFALSLAAFVVNLNPPSYSQAEIGILGELSIVKASRIQLQSSSCGLLLLSFNPSS